MSAKPLEEETGMGTKLRRALVAVVVTMAIALVATTESQSAGNIPGYAVKIGGHRLRGESAWSIWLFGARPGEGCWGSRATGRGNTSEGMSCGFEVPGEVWQLLASGRISRRESVLALLARPGIERLASLVERAGARSKHWQMASVHVIRGARARAARLPYAVGYSVIEIPAGVRALRVRAIQFDKVVATGRLPKC